MKQALDTGVMGSGREAAVRRPWARQMGIGAPSFLAAPAAWKLAATLLLIAAVAFMGCAGATPERAETTSAGPSCAWLRGELPELGRAAPDVVAVGVAPGELSRVPGGSGTDYFACGSVVTLVEPRSPWCRGARQLGLDCLHARRRELEDVERRGGVLLLVEVVPLVGPPGEFHAGLLGAGDGN